MFENYLPDLPDALKYIVCKFGTVNPLVPIETGRYTRIPKKGYVKCVIVVNWGAKNSTFTWNVLPGI